MMYLPNLLLHEVKGVPPNERVIHASPSKKVSVLSKLQKARVSVQTPKTIIFVGRHGDSFFNLFIFLFAKDTFKRIICQVFMIIITYPHKGKYSTIVKSRD